MESYKKLSQPSDFPAHVNAVVEISANSGAVKYEIDQDGILHVDRFLPVSMHYPCNYGFIPNTMGGDGDPVDILIITREPIFPKSVIKVRVLGVLIMKDEKGMDEKILAVPAKTVDLFYDNLKDLSDLPKIELERISHFFKRYKELEDGKTVEILGWKGLSDAVLLLSGATE